MAEDRGLTSLAPPQAQPDLEGTERKSDKADDEIPLTPEPHVNEEPSRPKPELTSASDQSVESATTTIEEIASKTKPSIDTSDSRELPPYFLSGCTATSLGSSDWGEVSAIGEYCLAGCEALETVEFGDALRRITNVPYYFMAFCPLLRTIDCSSLVNVTTVESCFGCGCTSITNIDLNGLCSVRSIGARFLEGCKSLVRVDAGNLAALETIGERFLAECTSLEELNLKDCTKISTIESQFLLNCRLLQHMDLPVFKRLEKFRARAFQGCNSLPSVDRSHFPQFTVSNLQPLIAIPLSGGIIKSAPSGKTTTTAGANAKSIKPAQREQLQSLLLRLPADALAIVYSWMPPHDCGSFRATCHSTVDAFNAAVELETIIPYAGSEDPDAADPLARSVSPTSPRWFPVVLWRPRFQNPPVVSVNAVSCLLDAASSRPWTYGIVNTICSIRVRGDEQVDDQEERWNMMHFPNLAIADVDCFQNSRTIPSDFFRGCRSLHRLTLHLSPAVKVITEYALSSTGSLLNTDFLSELPGLETIRKRFLSGSSIRSIAITGLRFLTTIEDYFGECCHVRGVHLVDLPSLKTIGARFLACSDASFEVTLENLPKLEEIKTEFLDQCARLTSIVIQGTPSLRHISKRFARQCPQLKAVEMGEQPSLVEIGGNFLDGCLSLEKISLSGLRSLQEIGHKFLLGCRSLPNVSFGPMPSLTTMSMNFMGGCASIRELRIDAPSVESVSDNFLQECTALTSLDISTFSPKAKPTIECLKGCTSLRDIHVPCDDFFPKERVVLLGAKLHVNDS